jgi:hypothetical protein
MDWDKIKLGFWSAIGGAVLLAVIGFNWGGWVTHGTAEAMAKEIAAVAVAERFAPFCVAQFNKDSERDQKLKEFKEKDSWNGQKYVEAQGWATIFGEKTPDAKVAELCAKQLMEST